MARYGVVADIHGNHEALRATLAALDARGVERYLCLGDVVGYNAGSDPCVAEVRGRNMRAVAGNHDLIAIGRLGLERCSRKAAHALRRTRRGLGGEARDYLARLPLREELEGGVVLVHAGVEDVQLYVRTPAEVARNAALLAAAAPGARLCLFGHTHDAAAWEVHAGAVRAVPAEGTLRLREDAAYFVNPGSVDSARDREPGHARCAVFDSAARTVEFLAVPYDHAAAEEKARRGGYRPSAWLSRLRRLARR